MGAAILLGTPILVSQPHVHAEQRVYASGYVCINVDGVLLHGFVTIGLCVFSEALGRGVRLEIWKAQVSCHRSPYK